MHLLVEWIGVFGFGVLSALSENKNIRHQIAQNIKKLYKQQNQHPTHGNKQTSNENRVINQINEKLTKNKAMISKTDKGSSVIVSYQEEYKDKINKFIASNNFTIANSDVTKKLQRDIRNTVNECQQIIHKSDRWKYVNLNPTAPTIRGLVKVHKEGTTIGPIVSSLNCRQERCTHTSPYLTRLTWKTAQLMNDVTDLPYDRNIKFASHDINNMYSNVPIEEMITILGKLCEINSIEDKTKQDILKITQVIVEQNYFRFQDMIYVQNEGLMIGAPAFSIFSEIYLQNLENTKITKLLLKHEVEGYFIYINDILILYKEDQTNIHNVLDYFNSVTPNMKFTLEKEENNKINFLDITIAKGHDSLLFEIYRKPTTTDVIIPNDSCHPSEHKTAAIGYSYNRMKSYKLTPESQQKERNMIQQILVNNNYEASTLNTISEEKKQNETLKKENGRSSHISGRK